MSERVVDFGGGAVAVIDISPDLPLPAANESHSEAGETVTNPDQPATIAEKTEPKSDKSYEQVVAEVSEYFGDRIFTFKIHSGTAVQMAAICPMAQMAFGRGTEFAISFLERWDGTPPDPKPDDPKKDDPKQIDNTLPDTKSDDQDGGSEKRNINVVEAKQDRSESAKQIGKAMMAQVALSATKQESKPQAKEADAAQKKESSSTDDRLVVAKQVERTAIITKTEQESPVDNKLESRSDPDTTPTPLPFAADQKVDTMTDDPVPVIVEVPVKDRTEIDHIAEVIEQPVVVDQPTLEPVMVPVAVVKVEQLVVEEPDEIVMANEMTETVVEVLPTIIQPTEQQPVDSPVIVMDVIKQEPVAPIDTVQEMKNEPVASTENDVTLPESIDSEQQEYIQEIPIQRDDDYVYETIAVQLGFEDNDEVEMTVQPIELSSERSDLAEITPPNPLAEMIVDRMDEQINHIQQSTENTLTEVVRGIEILKRAQSAEDCRDAVEQLKQKLTLFYENQGYANPEQLAVELLENYHMQAIDEAMNEALRQARASKHHGFRIAPAVRSMLGKHVVSLLFGTAMNGMLFRSIFFAPNKSRA